MKISTMQKKRIAITIFILLAVLLLFPPSVLSECPKPEYSLNELRSDIRKIVFGFLSNPASSPYYSSAPPHTQQIQDLLKFYRDNKDASLVGSCDAVGTRSRESISAILAKTIVYQKECNDGFDNDGDGKTDLSDSGCTDLNDSDETNCGDKICESSETCSSCSSDCGVCKKPAKEK